MVRLNQASTPNEIEKSLTTTLKLNEMRTIVCAADNTQAIPAAAIQLKSGGLQFRRGQFLRIPRAVDGR